MTTRVSHMALFAAAVLSTATAADAQKSVSAQVPPTPPMNITPPPASSVFDVRFDIAGASVPLPQGQQTLLKLAGTKERPAGSKIGDATVVPSCSQISGKLSMKIWGSDIATKKLPQLTLRIQVGSAGNFVWQTTTASPQPFPMQPFTFAEGVTLPSGLHIITAKFDETMSALQTFGLKLECDPWILSSAAMGLAAAMPDTSPDPFNFPAVNNAPPNQETQSAMVTVGGINRPAPVAVQGCSAFVNGQPSLQIAPGQALQLRMVSSPNFATNKSCQVTVGGYTTTWTVRTLTPDTTPDPFTIAPKTNVEPNVSVTSDPVTVTGLGYPTTVSTSTAGCTVQVDGGAPGQQAQLQNGQALRVQTMSAPNYGVTKGCQIQAGSFSTTWNVTTMVADMTPNSFQFPTKSDAMPGSVVPSDALTIAGINVPTNVSFGQGVVDCEHQINNGTWTAQPGTITNGQSLRLRAKAVDQLGGLRACTFNVGTTQSQWGVYTTIYQPAPSPTPVFAFPGPIQQNVPVQSNSVTVTFPYDGAKMNVGASHIGMDCRLSVNNGPWVGGIVSLPTGPVSLRVQVTLTQSSIWPAGGYCGGSVGSAPYQAKP